MAATPTLFPPGTKSRIGGWPFPEALPYPPGYTPSEWVASVVGGTYRTWGEQSYVCIGYDRRFGFWMQDVADPHNFTNVSERAIGRTYHLVPEAVR